MQFRPGEEDADMAKGTKDPAGNSGGEELSLEELGSISGGGHSVGWKIGHFFKSVAEHLPGVGAIVRGIEHHESAKDIVKNYFKEGAIFAAGGPGTAPVKVATSIVKSTISSAIKK
jgi:hypothetical protein